MAKRGGRSPRPWVAIDDRDLLAESRECGGDGFEGHFVHTDVITGLTQELADQAIAILSSAKEQSSKQPSRSPPRRRNEQDAPAGASEAVMELEVE